MAITTRTEIGQRTLLADGQLQVRIDTVVENDGVEISRTYFRKVLAPGDDVTNEDASVKAVANAAWTQAVVDAYKAKKRG